ncbi:MAG: TetR family transcriptional regulator [Frankiales bacterium]|nr:TetR family transcriptional regulator [Frankiales bacterium]
MRTRDPARKERLLEAAAALISESGYHTVSMADLGAATGITASAVYRHFESKSAVLVALLDSVVDDLLRDARQIVLEAPTPGEALRRLVGGQVAFVMEQRALAQVYGQEVHNLPDVDARRLRRTQRIYLEEWVKQLLLARPELEEEVARNLVHAALGAIQSRLHHRSALPDEQLSALLDASGRAVLGVQ